MKEESHVAHVDDLPLAGKIDEDYPIDVERRMFNCIEQEIQCRRDSRQKYFDMLKGKNLTV